MEESVRKDKERITRETKTFTLSNYSVEVITNDRRDIIITTYVSGLRHERPFVDQQEILCGLTLLNRTKSLLCRLMYVSRVRQPPAANLAANALALFGAKHFAPPPRTLNAGQLRRF